MRLVNLTSSVITVYDSKGITPVLTIPRSLPTIQGTDSSDLVREIPVQDDDGGEFQIRVVRGEFSVDEENVPPPQEGVIYVVGYAALQALNNRRDDVIAPDTSRTSAVRGANGSIIGVKRFRVA